MHGLACFLHLFGTCSRHVDHSDHLFRTFLAPVVGRADSVQARRIVIRVNIGKTCLVADQIRRRKCLIASTYKINIQTPFWHLQSTCWSFWHRLIRPNTMTTSGSAANSTATMPVPYRQRLNGPNVKSTSGSTAGCSEFVVLLRGPSEQPGNARAEQHTNIRGQGTTEEEPCCRTTPLPWVSGPISIRESRSYWTAGGSRVGI